MTRAEAYRWYRKNGKRRDEHRYARRWARWYSSRGAWFARFFPHPEVR